MALEHEITMQLYTTALLLSTFVALALRVLSISQYSYRWTTHKLARAVEDSTPVIRMGNVSGSVVVPNVPRTSQTVVDQKAVQQQNRGTASSETTPEYDLNCVNTLSGDRYPANPVYAHSFDNEFCEGQVIFLVQPRGNTARYADYFRGKKRQFEIQFQFRFKQRPGALFYGIELEKSVRLGPTKKAFVHAVMAIMKAAQRKHFHYSIAGDNVKSDGMYEKPHIAFSLEGTVDNIVITRPGEVPPKLGREIPIDERSAAQRRQNKGSIDWNTKDTYTWNVFSANVDFHEWAVVNLPGLAARGIDTIIGPQHMNFNVYSIPKQSKNHHQAEMKPIVNLELGHESKTRPGPFLKKWASASNNAPYRRQEQPRSTSRKARNQHKYLENGQHVTLVVNGLGQLAERHDGFAAIHNRTASSPAARPPALVVVERAHEDMNPQQLDGSPNLLRVGDRVVIKLLSDVPADSNGAAGGGKDLMQYRYLTKHQGRERRLKWASKLPTGRNGVFTLGNANDNYDGSAAPSKVGMPLLAGSEVVLHHAASLRYWAPWQRTKRFVSLQSDDRAALFLGGNPKKAEPLRIRIVHRGDGLLLEQ